MTPLLFIGVCAAGGLGAALRFLIDGLVRTRWPTDPPLGTMVVNVTGSLLLGLLTGLAAAAVAPEQLQAVLGTGFLGGYTTFSTAAVETVRLAGQGRRFATLAHGIGMLIGSVTAAAVGFLVGSGSWFTGG